MEQVGVFDAKVHLSKLLQRASQGETIVITRNGRPMAKLSPADEKQTLGLMCEDAITVLRDIRSRTTTNDGLSIRDLISEGRRY